jgi:hypothetical protein
MVSATPPPPQGGHRYLLCDLLWCGLCDRPMAPVFFTDSEWGRYYLCGNAACIRLPMAAEIIEDLVWFEYAQLYSLTNPWCVFRPERGPRLAEALERVTVGLQLFERTYRWHD